MSALDSKTALTLLGRGGVFWAKFAAFARDLSAKQILALMAALEKRASHDATIFLRALLDTSSDQSVLATWREGLEGLQSIQSYPFDATKKAKKLRQIAKSDRVLAAWQAAAVGSARVQTDVLALLLIDSSEASIDALMPLFQRSLGVPARLEQLESVARYETPATAAMFGLTRQALSASRGTSPVLAFGEKLGLASKGRFRVTVRVRAKKRPKRFTFDFAQLVLDSDGHPGFMLTRGQETITPSSSSMWQRQIRCGLTAIPRALAKIAREAKLEWDFEGATIKPGGTARAAALLEWLRAPKV